MLITSAPVTGELLPGFRHQGLTALVTSLIAETEIHAYAVRFRITMIGRVVDVNVKCITAKIGISRLRNIVRRNLSSYFACKATVVLSPSRSQ